LSTAMLSALQELMLVFLTEKNRIIYTRELYIIYTETK
jgi:hypothetical protein